MDMDMTCEETPIHMNQSYIVIKATHFVYLALHNVYNTHNEMGLTFFKTILYF